MDNFEDIVKEDKIIKQFIKKKSKLVHPLVPVKANKSTEK